MEEFVAEIQNGMNRCENPTPKRFKRYRELFGYFCSSNPEVKIVEKCTDEGDSIFEVPMKSVGLSYEVLMKYKNEMCSEFTANFLGEMLIRENMELFVNMLIEIKDMYSEVVNKYDHKKFGLKIFRDKLVFSFHISLLQKMLTDDFKKKI